MAAVQSFMFDFILRTFLLLARFFGKTDIKYVTNRGKYTRSHYILQKIMDGHNTADNFQTTQMQLESLNHI